MLRWELGDVIVLKTSSLSSRHFELANCTFTVAGSNLKWIPLASALQELNATDSSDSPLSVPPANLLLDSMPAFLLYPDFFLMFLILVNM